jgi:hypothetical protein
MRCTARRATPAPFLAIAAGTTRPRRIVATRSVLARVIEC